MTNKAKEISCRDTTWLVSDARERDLTAEEKRDLAHHIESCELCQGASRQFDVLFRKLKEYVGHEIKED